MFRSLNNIHLVYMMHIKKIVTIGAILLTTWLVQSNVSFAETIDADDLNIVIANDNGDSLFLGPISIDATTTTAVVTDTGTSTDVADNTLASVIQRASVDGNASFSNPIFTDSGLLFSVDYVDGTLTGPWNINKTDIPVSGNLFTETLASGDAITIIIGTTTRIDIPNSATTAIATLPLNIAVESFNGTTWGTQLEGALVAVFDTNSTIVATSTSNADGIAQFRIPTPGNYVVNFADRSGVDFQVTITNTIPSDKVVFRVRGNQQIIFEDAIDLPTTGTTTLPEGQEVDSRSVSAILSTLSMSASTTLVFTSTSSTVYLDSMSINGAPTTPWLHAINGTISNLVSNEILSGGEDVRFFDAAQFRTTFSTTTVATGTPVEITFEKFDVSDMNTDAYIPDAGIDIGAALASTSAEVATTTTDGDGIASFTFNTPGTYRIAKIIDGYENGTDIIILDSSSTTTPTTTDPGTGTGTTTQTSFATDLAVNFLINNRATSTVEQKEWNAIAFSVVEIEGPNQTAFNSEKTFLASFLKTGELSGTEPRDLARRILALLAIGENPYTAGSVDRVANLVSMFNGASFGTGPTTSVTTIDNAYAVLALKNAGYAMSESMMQTAIASIKSTQMLDGSWNNDFNATAVALETLSLESSTSPEAVKAKEYLEQEQNPSNAAWSTNDEATTARVLLSLFAVGVQDSNLIQSSWTPLSYLADKQGKETGQDGSVGNMTSLNERITATALTIIAMTEESLDIVITDTSKPVVAATTTPSTTLSSSSGGGRSSMSQNAPAPVTTPSQDVLRFIESRTGLKGNTMIFVGTVSQPQVRTTPATPKKTVIVATAPQQKPIIALSTTTPSTTPATQNIAGVGAVDTRGFFATLGSRMKNGFKILLSPIFSH